MDTTEQAVVPADSGKQITNPAERMTEVLSAINQETRVVDGLSLLPSLPAMDVARKIATALYGGNVAKGDEASDRFIDFAKATAEKGWFPLEDNFLYVALLAYTDLDEAKRQLHALENKRELSTVKSGRKLWYTAVNGSEQGKNHIDRRILLDVQLAWLLAKVLIAERSGEFNEATRARLYQDLNTLKQQKQFYNGKYQLWISQKYGIYQTSDQLMALFLEARLAKGDSQRIIDLQREYTQLLESKSLVEKDTGLLFPRMHEPPMIIGGGWRPGGVPKTSDQFLRAMVENELGMEGAQDHYVVAGNMYNPQTKWSTYANKGQVFATETALQPNIIALLAIQAFDQTKTA